MPSQAANSCPRCAGTGLSFHNDVRHRALKYPVRGPRKARGRASRKRCVASPPLPPQRTPFSALHRPRQPSLLQAQRQRRLVPGTFYRWHRAPGNERLCGESLSPWPSRALGEPRPGPHSPSPNCVGRGTEGPLERVLGDGSLRLWGPLVQASSGPLACWRATGFLRVSHAPANGTSTRPQPHGWRGVPGGLYGVSNNFYLQHDAVPPSQLGTAQHSSQPGAPPSPQPSRPGDTLHSEPRRPQEAKPLSWWAKAPATSGEREVKCSSPLATGRGEHGHRQEPRWPSLMGHSGAPPWANSFLRETSCHPSSPLPPSDPA